MSKQRQDVTVRTIKNGSQARFIVRYPDKTWGFDIILVKDQDTLVFNSTMDPGFIITKNPEDTRYHGLYHDCEQSSVSGDVNLTPLPDNFTLNGKQYKHPWFITTLPSSCSRGGITGEPVFYKGHYYDSSIFVRVTASRQDKWLCLAYSYEETWLAPDGTHTRERHSSRRMDVFSSRTYPLTINKEWVPHFVAEYLSLSKFERQNLISAVDRQVQWGDLSAKAAESVRELDINSIAYLRDFGALGKLAKSVIPTGSSLSSFKSAAKAISGVYLGHHYGTRLTINDTWKIAKAIDRLDPSELWQTMGSEKSGTIDTSGHHVQYTRRLTAKIRGISDDKLRAVDSVNEAIDQLSNRIRRVGYEADLLPTLANIWDLVPFSFVIDWFVPIGDAFENIERANYLETLPISVVFLSDKFIWTDDQTRSFENYQLQPSLSRKYYRRVCRSVLPLPSMHVDNPRSFSGHWLEATALILQNVL